ncbi:MAG: hypothetical protein H6574_11060 [Lewinellaceae bacterium]|nr:hypothetical protein [Saprospiraceae bacterium]MCB9316898.1 hypothetical protein [Lewinellaceae bacterium]MCB9331614.1 hypothetical protein [Lewinellaceae bacterium]
MSKKKFAEGLDELFNDLPADTHTWGHATDAPVRERKTGSKNFMDDLDELFHDALVDSPDNLQESEQPAASTPRTKSKSTGSFRSPMSGLDTLIRQTVDVRELTEDEQSGKKRLTVAIDREKLLKIKTIARLENAYLKDLMVQLIDEYIREYTTEKGIDL